eukprot:scaffold327_cov257-Pinguiococcus_pyrenoidosus.AAC.24
MSFSSSSRSLSAAPARVTWFESSRTLPIVDNAWDRATRWSVDMYSSMASSSTFPSELARSCSAFSSEMRCARCRYVASLSSSRTLRPSAEYSRRGFSATPTLWNANRQHADTNATRSSSS